jgi:type II secretory pathway pseudopilin PulG
MAILGVLSAVSFPTWTNYQSKQRLISSTRDVVSVLRHAQAHAVAYSSTARVDIAADGQSLTEYLFSPNSATPPVWSYQQTGRVVLASGVTVASYAFTSRTGGTSTSIFFFSRGTATNGSLTLRRAGATRRVTVEGVTGRVAYT